MLTNQNKAIIAVAVMALMLFPVVTITDDMDAAKNITFEGVVYSADDSSKTATVTGFAKIENDFDRTIYKTIVDSSNGNIFTVTKFATGQLSGLDNVKNLTVEPCLTINSSNFYVSTASSAKLISYTSLDISETITIGDYAFYNQALLETFSTSEDITSVGKSAFAKTSITAFSASPSSGTLSIGDYAFSESDLSDFQGSGDISSIGMNAFRGCSDLTWFPFDRMVGTDIGMYTFAESGIKTINLNGTSSWTDIPRGLFSNCRYLTNVDIGSTATIGAEAFSGCIRMTSADAGSCTSVGISAFEGCTALSSIDMFRIADVGAKAFKGCSSLEDIDFGGMMHVGDSAFEGCTGLREFSFGGGSSVAELAKNLFKGCSSLKTVWIPLSATVVKEGAFTGCISLEEVYVPHYDMDGVLSLSPTSFACGNDASHIITFHAVGRNHISDYDENASAFSIGGTAMATPEYDCEGAFAIIYDLGCTDAVGGPGYEIHKGIGKTFKISSIEPIRTGYLFNGWSTNPNGSDTVEQIQSTGGSVKIYAKWIASVAVHYDNDVTVQGLVDNTEHIEKGTIYKVRSPSGYTNSLGQSFAGWSLDGQTSVSELTAEQTQNDVVLTALWVSKSYKITFDANGGTGTVSPGLCYHGESYSLPKNPGLTKEGYTFCGWSTYRSATSGTYMLTYVTENKTMYAVWKENSDVEYVTVSFDANGGTGTMSSAKAVKGADYTLPAKCDFSWTGCVFVGWSLTVNGSVYTILDNIRKDTTMYAVWERAAVISFDANGGTGTMPSEYTQFGKDYTLPAICKFSKSGFMFTGWSLSPSGNIISVIKGVEKDTKVYAVWDRAFVLSFNLSGGVGETPESQFVTSKSIISLPSYVDAEFPGKEFKGWMTADGRKADSSLKVTSDTTLFAIWKASFTISFDANGGTGVVDNIKVDEGRSYTLPSSTAFTRDGYHFIGWSLERNGSQTTLITDICKDTAVFALWEKDPSTQPDIPVQYLILIIPIIAAIMIAAMIFTRVKRS